MKLLLTLGIFVLFGLVPAAIAHSKGRSFRLWWLYGALLSLPALVHALLMAPTPAARDKRLLSAGMKPCGYCAEFIRADARLCRFCGREAGDGGRHARG